MGVDEGQACDSQEHDSAPRGESARRVEAARREVPLRDVTEDAAEAAGAQLPHDGCDQRAPDSSSSIRGIDVRIVDEGSIRGTSNAPLVIRYPDIVPAGLQIGDRRPGRHLGPRQQVASGKRDCELVRVVRHSAVPGESSRTIRRGIRACEAGMSADRSRSCQMALLRR